MDESNLYILTIYVFLGYSDNINCGKLIDFSTKISNRDSTFYVVFEEKNVYQNLTKSDYFTFTFNPIGYKDYLTGEFGLPKVDEKYEVIGPA